MKMEAVGWLSSFTLVLTIGKQVFKQWKDDTSKGVSKWLYLGQFASSTGFIVYSWSLQNWVFVVTNVVLLATNIVGFAILIHHRRRARRLAGPAAEKRLAA